MKIELKHIAPYLPYGLKVLRPDNRTVLEVEGVANGMYIFTENGMPENTYGDLYASKPILRPMSDFNKKLFKEVKKTYPNTEGFSVVFDIGLSKYPSLAFSSITEWCIIQWMIERHFDVFGLIDQGLAIDINTLNQF